ncbi:hypothetical protein RBA41_01635 [Massilia sp. CCM 9210]|uniref:hypothetical protein n=1 Tax=Massilia scottii TaxID=3057166 RepID=UPI00279679B2|nr:hypothetical protein [Massilia sp. CCM 9210]MDQ1811997.1 hypothetical protein [Massilia sp. CCM 9210]
MNPSIFAARASLAIFLRTLRCFNAAAFVALAFFYFASHCLPPLPAFPMQLIALTQPVH